MTDQTTSGTQVLPLICEDGAWVENPGRMFLAALCHTKEKDILGTYLAMQGEARSGPEPTQMAKTIISKVIEKDWKRRYVAGCMVLEMVAQGNASLAAGSPRPCEFARAARAVRAEIPGTQRWTEQSFEIYRLIAHYLAVWTSHPNLVDRVEFDAEAAGYCLGLATGFQEFLSNNYDASGWGQVTVPDQVQAITRSEVRRLPPAER
jgi:hypothetical protein